MQRTSRPHLVAAASLLALALGAAVLHASDSAAKSTLELHLRAGGEADALVIDDLERLAVGERRDYATDAGRPVSVTREENGYHLDVDGQTVRIGDAEGEPFAGGAPTMTMRRIEIDGDGDAHELVLSADPPEDRVVFFRRAPGARGFAFSTAGETPGLLFTRHSLLHRLERSEKFRALDDATQELVRELVAEAAAAPFPGTADEGDEKGDRLEIWLERQ